MSHSTLYMRIGADKAGTVSLAKLVINNRDTFLRNNRYAPIRNCMPVFDHFVKKNNLTSIDTFDSTKFLSKKAHNKQFSELMNQYEKYKDFDIFLTTETFWGRLSKKNVSKCSKDIRLLCDTMMQYFRYHHFKIILNIRRIDTYIESLYKQEIKAGRFISIEHLKKRLAPKKVFDLLLLLEDIFGKQNVIVRPFERSQMVDGDLVSDTLQILNLYESINDFKIQIENEGLHRDLCETLIILNKEYGKLIGNRKLLMLSKMLKKEYKFPDIKYILSKKDREELLSNFDEFYNYLSVNYNKGNPFFIDPLPDDSHLQYSLPQDRFDMIKQMIFDISKKQSSVA